MIRKLNGTQGLVADKDAIWSLWQAPIGESQWKPLGFRSKALPSSADNHSIEEQLLACSWTFVDTEDLTTGQQVTMGPELPMMNGVPSDPPNHKVTATVLHQVEMMYV